MLRFANKIGNAFGRGIHTFNRMAPKIGRNIGEVAKIGRNIGEVSKAARQIGQSANVISGGRLSPYADKANEVLSKIEAGGEFVANNEGNLKNVLNTVSRKLNA